MFSRSFQELAANKIVSAYNDQSCSIATICISSGLGVRHLLAKSINRILKVNPKAKVLYLCRCREEASQFINVIIEMDYGLSVCDVVNDYSKQSVLAITYSTYFARKKEIKCDLLICVAPEDLNSEKYNQLLNEKCRLLLGVFADKQRSKNNLFRNAPCIVEFNYNQEYLFLEMFAVPMLRHIGYTEIQTDKEFLVNDKVIRPDIVALKDGLTNFIEIKTYRGMFNDREIVRRAIDQIKKYKIILEHEYPNSQFGVILICDVEESAKCEIAKEYGIFVWDIKNLLYICSENSELTSILEQITSYPVNGIKPEKPIEANIPVKSKAPIETDNKYETELIERLKTCKPGKTKKADKEYEKICAQIIDYLFKNEFSQFYEQHSTKDDMFRMDIICGLKGTVAFWKFLIRYYNTRFVVFECKNYSHKIEQNLIYVTDKYLFNPVLRNVAFIISRKGFSDNAQKAALGILKEQGKLILDLTDLDLEIMIKGKSEGKEPSDFLLDKVEKLLMSVSI